ncbi:MAG: hypothetical protein ACKVVP_22290 [Chloroflexota bacterium]
MTLESHVWLVRLADEFGQPLAARLTASTGLIVQTVASLNETIMRLSESAPRLAIADGNFGQTERLKLYAALQDHASDGEIPVIFASQQADAVAIEIVGSPSVDVVRVVSASDLVELVRGYAAPSVPGLHSAQPQAMVDAGQSSASLGTERTSPAPVADDSAVHVAVREPVQGGVSVGPANQMGTPAPTPAPPREPNAFEQLFSALVRRWWLALAVLATVMAANVYYTMTREKTYLARASLIISPSANVDRGSLVYSVDSLGRGRIVGTYAEVLGSEVVHRVALERLGLPSTALGTSVTFKSSTVADTAVVQVTAESPDPELSAQAANHAGEVGIEHMTGLFPVYNLVFLSRATPPMTVYRPDPVRNYSVGLLIGIILATVIAYATDNAVRRVSARPSPAGASEKKKSRKSEAVLKPGNPPTAVRAVPSGQLGLLPEPPKPEKKSWFSGVSKSAPVAPVMVGEPHREAETPSSVTARSPEPLREDVPHIAMQDAQPKRGGLLNIFRTSPKPNNARGAPAAVAQPDFAPKELAAVPTIVPVRPGVGAPQPEKKAEGSSFLGRFFKQREKAGSGKKSVASSAAQDEAVNRLERVLSVAPSAGQLASSGAFDDSGARDRNASAVA